MTHQQTNVSSRKEASKLGQVSWALFDWANQPFFTIITTFIFAPYFANVMVGDPVKGQAAWAFTQSTSGILIALMSPFLGAMADAVSIPVIAAGGLASVDDIAKLKARKGVPVSGAVLGRALYNGAIDPAHALETAA